MTETILPTLQAPRRPRAQNQQGTPVSCDTTLPTTQKPPPDKPPPTPPPPPPQNRGSFISSCCAAGRRPGRHRQLERPSSVNPTGHCDSTPTRRKAVPDEAQGEPPTQATQDPKAHRHHTGTPTAAGTSTARQPESSQHSAFAKSPPRAGQARPQPGARPPRFDSTRSATLATRQIPPKVEPTVMRLNGRD